MQGHTSYNSLSIHSIIYSFLNKNIDIWHNFLIIRERYYISSIATYSTSEFFQMTQG